MIFYRLQLASSSSCKFQVFLLMLCSFFHGNLRFVVGDIKIIKKTFKYVFFEINYYNDQKNGSWTFMFYEVKCLLNFHSLYYLTLFIVFSFHKKRGERDKWTNESNRCSCLCFEMINSSLWLSHVFYVSFVANVCLSASSANISNTTTTRTQKRSNKYKKYNNIKKF